MPAATLLDRRSLAGAFDVHMQTVTGWERQGMPVAERGARGRPTRYRLPDVVAWRIAREMAARGAGDTPIDPRLERALLDRARREQVDIAIAEKRGELLPRAEWVSRNQRLAVVFTAKARSIPARLAQVGVPANEPAMLAVIDEMLREISAIKTTQDLERAAAAAQGDDDADDLEV